jgi:hypothetical protein
MLVIDYKSQNSHWRDRCPTYGVTPTGAGQWQHLIHIEAVFDGTGAAIQSSKDLYNGTPQTLSFRTIPSTLPGNASIMF